MRRIVTQVADVDVGVRFFYPSIEHAAVTGFGAWMLHLVKNARMRAETYPLVMVSHGLGGNRWNHHLLAQSLVKAGFIVAAVGHPDDLLRLGSPEHMVMRPLELKAGLDAVLLDNGFKAQIDPECIGIFGYSLGGFTALAAAGGRASFSQIVKHCATSRNDLAFCIGNKSVNALPICRPPRVHLDQDLYDPRFKALVLAAPVGGPIRGS